MSGIQQLRANLEVASRLGARAVRRKFSGGTGAPPDQRAFRSQFTTLLAGMPKSLVAEYRFVDLPATTPPWSRSGLDLAVGDSITSFACGRTYLSQTLDVWLEPAFQLWFRIGVKGPIFRGTRDSHSFTARLKDRLDLASYWPGEWRSPNGELRTPKDDYSRVSGSLCVLLVRWATGVNPQQGVEQLLAHGDVDGRVADELQRLTAAHRPPEGWTPLWFVGDGEVFERADCEGRSGAIACDTERDAEILLHDVDLPMTDDTVLEWSWNVAALPSTLREDTLPTHDCLGVAVEYDNGQTLSYLWSAALPVDTHFACPLPTWRNRHTVYVVRHGPEGLGQWRAESRHLARDYAAAVQSPIEVRRILRIWLIGSSLFQHHPGRGVFADIRLTQAGTTLEIK
ncbi:MAG TPA: DUF3047 domain-containing protein [Nevskiaceae bacterium]|nr:DUF3047 domain-containing protein [Nevskiaceae bacterium]